MMVHCDYAKTSFAPFIHSKITKYIGVSKRVCESFTNITGIDCELCYNPVYIEKPKVKKKKGLHIIYAGRLSSEKNGVLIDKFREVMDKSGIEYDLTVYTNKNVRFLSNNVIVKKPKLDLTKEISESTYMLITSKHEAFCLSAIESLYLGTPLICTDLPVFEELGVDDTNSIKIGFNLEGFNPKDLLRKWDFTYTLPKDNWEKYLSTKKDYDPEELVEVKVLKGKLIDIYEGKTYKRGDRYKTVKWRASYLEAKGYVEW